jgi:ribonuclease VapC
MIVDTSALIAVLRREPDADRLADHLLATSEVRLAAGTLLETRIVAERDGGSAELEELLEVLGGDIVPADARQADLAFDGLRRFGKGRHPAALNLGDLFAYALARALGEPLLFKRDDFVQTDVEAM